ncbi:6584_t:CDS:2, partial [Paraglomus occultum]
PLLAKDLGGLGQLYVTCGNAERLRDESILLAYKASKTCSDLFEGDHTDGQHEYEPTKVTLHVYDAMPHVFQIFGFHPAAMDGISRTARFIRKVIPSRPSTPGNRSPERHSNDSKDLPSSLYGAELRVNCAIQGEDENEDEFASEDEAMLIKRVSVNGKSREFEGMEEPKLKEWVGALGKLPEFTKNQEIFMKLLNV